VQGQGLVASELANQTCLPPMALPRPSKRRSEQATNEPRKRQRTGLDPESLRTQAKTLTHPLLDSLANFLELLPDNDSTKTDRMKIEDIQMTCRAILNDRELNQTQANLLEIDLETDFLIAHAHQGNTRH